MGGGGYSSPVQYVLKLEQFVVAQTRSGDKDTAVVAFRAQVGDLLYPLQTKRIENVHNGGTYVINLEIGPILAPINTPVTFFYSIVNSGYDTSDTNVARQLADGLSDLAAGFCTLVFGQGAVWDKLNELTKKINKSGFVNCDGPVAAGGQPVAIDILDQWTPNGLYRQSDHFVRPTSATSPPCHGQSDYTVSWSVEAKRAILDLPAIASDGHLRRAFRWYDGFWQALRQDTSTRTFVDVSNAGSLDNQIHLCVITPDGGIWHTIVSEAHDVKKLTNDNPGAFSRVGIATLLGELHVCGITPHDGNIWHTIRHLDGSWQPNFGRVKDQTSNPGTFVDVSGAGIAGAGELHVCGITVDGGIWHTIRHLDGNWQPFFGNVKSQAGNPGTFQRISIASVFNELHVCGVTADGGIWHTIRHADGSWLPFSDVKSQGGSNTGAFVDVGTTRMNDELHLCGITADGSIWHTVRHAAGWWELFENVTGQVDGQGRFLAVSITEFFEARRPPQVSIGDLSNSKVSFSVNVPATDLHGNYPIVSAGPYDLSIFSLRGSLKIQWMGGQGTTIVNPTAASVVVDCDMTGNTKMGDGQDFQISVLVTDQFGVSVSDQKTISINVIGNKGE